MFGVLSCPLDCQSGSDGQGTCGKGIWRGRVKGMKTWSRADAVERERETPCSKHGEGRTSGLALDWAGGKELGTDERDLQRAGVGTDLGRSDWTWGDQCGVCFGHVGSGQFSRRGVPGGVGNGRISEQVSDTEVLGMARGPSGDVERV